MSSTIFSCAFVFSSTAIFTGEAVDLASKFGVLQAPTKKIRAVSLPFNWRSSRSPRKRGEFRVGRGAVYSVICPLQIVPSESGRSLDSTPYRCVCDQGYPKPASIINRKESKSYHMAEVSAIPSCIVITVLTTFW